MHDAEERLRQNVRELLEFTRRTQAALADYLGLSQPQVSLLLNGKRAWRMSQLSHLADFFSVSVPALFVDGTFERRTGHDRRSGRDRRNK